MQRGRFKESYCASLTEKETGASSVAKPASPMPSAVYQAAPNQAVPVMPSAAYQATSNQTAPVMPSQSYQNSPVLKQTNPGALPPLAPAQNIHKRSILRGLYAIINTKTLKIRILPSIHNLGHTVCL